MIAMVKYLKDCKMEKFQQKYLKENRKNILRERKNIRTNTKTVRILRVF